MRVKKAASILSDNTEMHVTDALAMCGFDNSSYFTRQFKSVMGITPREFVKKMRRGMGGCKPLFQV
ncbi:helix-turn-helix transcriptional regulator [bacterium]|nr:helix-turn-helix transcriptional regulator [bacterium]